MPLDLADSRSETAFLIVYWWQVVVRVVSFRTCFNHLRVFVVNSWTVEVTDMPGPAVDMHAGCNCMYMRNDRTLHTIQLPVLIQIS